MAAKVLYIGLPIGFEPSPQRAQWLDDVAAQPVDRSVSDGERGGIEPDPVHRTGPQREQDKVDVTPGAVLQRDQRLGHAGPRIQSQRETPETLACLSSRHAAPRLPHLATR